MVLNQDIKINDPRFEEVKKTLKNSKLEFVSFEGNYCFICFIYENITYVLMLELNNFTYFLVKHN